MALRSTFRKKCQPDGVCWQRQLRDQYAAEGSPIRKPDLSSARVRPVSKKFAEQIILKYEWLGTMGNSQYHYGLFFGTYCGGVCCFGAGAAPGGAGNKKSFGLPVKYVGYLMRGACVHWAPAGSNSKLIAFSLRLFAKESGSKIVVAYSDADAGEIGTVYQASNWIYIGLSGADHQWVAPNGAVRHRRITTDAARKNGVDNKFIRKTMFAAGWRYQENSRKGRYVYILDRNDKALIERIEGMRQSYPKRTLRGGSETVDTAGVQPEKGGSTPTPPLHIQP